MKSLEDIFIDRSPEIIGSFKKSSVFILIKNIGGTDSIVFEVRSGNLRNQPGDVCLPGGKVESNEEPLQTAIREVHEELGLKRDDIDYIGPMNYLVSPYNSIIYPYVGRVKSGKIICNPQEVEEIFTVPLSYFMKEKPILYELPIGPTLKEDFPYHLIRGGRNYKFSRGILPEYFYQYDGHVIWGFTALIIKDFIDLLKIH